ICVTPIATRSRVELESLIGLFVNTLALRSDLSNNPPFTDLVHQVRSHVLEAHAHQELPFEKLVEEMQLERSLSYTPIFQVGFSVQQAPPEDEDGEDDRITTLEIDTGTTKFDLTLSVLVARQGFRLTFEYDSDLYHQDTIRRMLNHFEVLLQAVAANPERKVSNLPL